MKRVAQTRQTVRMRGGECRSGNQIKWPDVCAEESRGEGDGGGPWSCVLQRQMRGLALEGGEGQTNASVDGDDGLETC
jgi:hypothetical protein